MFCNVDQEAAGGKQIGGMRGLCQGEAGSEFRRTYDNTRNSIRNKIP